MGLPQISRQDRRCGIGVASRIHRRRGLRERPRSIVDLKDPVPVAAVADDVAPGARPGAARLLRRHGGEEPRVEPVPPGGRRDLATESNADLCQGYALLTLFRDGGEN